MIRSTRMKVVAAIAALSLATSSVVILAQDGQDHSQQPAAATTKAAVASAQATTKEATTKEATTQHADAKVAPEAAAVLAKLRDAYTGLSSLKLDGKITGEFDVDGQKADEKVTFTSTFSAPNHFRHDTQGDAQLGSTGDKLYVYIKQRNAYLSADAPKQKVMSDDLPKPFAELIGQQNLSLALALSPDPRAELTRSYGTINKAADTTVDGKPYTTLELTAVEGKTVTRLLVDPATNLLRRATLDLAPDLLERGAKDVKRAVVTIDYTTTTPGEKLAGEQFAWTPPAGASDAAATADTGDLGPAGELVGSPAPDFTLAGMDGKDVKLADLKGSVVVLDFWATWCGPCVMSMPGLDRIHQAMKEQGVKVFAVNQAEDKELVQGFLTSKNLSLPVLLDTQSKVGEAYKVQGIPQTVVIGKDGTVRKVWVGAGPSLEEQIRTTVTEALKAAK
ncbi:MAG TPA: TlpA disulfide reductase family protein [Tepidisphaeraceae bacterium]|nr:TlpA disulfide reductase family protein [Tepidisphaeraceae bacterium]